MVMLQTHPLMTGGYGVFSAVVLRQVQRTVHRGGSAGVESKFGGLLQVS